MTQRFPKLPKSQLWRVTILLGLVSLTFTRFIVDASALLWQTPTVTENQGGMSFQFDSIPSQRRDDESFGVAPGDTLRSRLRVISHYQEERVFRLILLLNYRQVPFSLERIGQDAATPGTRLPAQQNSELVDLVVPPEDELRFRLWTEPLAEGYYDLALMVVTEPTQLDDLQFRTGFRPVLRRSVYVGDVVPPTVAFPLLDPDLRANTEFSELYIVANEPYSRKLWLGRVAQPGEEVSFYFNLQPRQDALLDPTVDETVPVALVAFLDDQIVPLNGEQVVYGAARPGYLSSIPVRLTMPDEPGPHQIYIQWFPQPYLDANVLESLSFFADAGQRVVIEVEAKGTGTPPTGGVPG